MGRTKPKPKLLPPEPKKSRNAGDIELDNLYLKTKNDELTLANVRQKMDLATMRQELEYLHRKNIDLMSLKERNINLNNVIKVAHDETTKSFEHFKTYTAQMTQHFTRMFQLFGTAKLLGNTLDATMENENSSIESNYTPNKSNANKSNFSSLNNSSSIKESKSLPKKQVVSPYKVNGHVLEVPTITLRRLMPPSSSTNAVAINFDETSGANNDSSENNQEDVNMESPNGENNQENDKDPEEEENQNNESLNGLEQRLGTILEDSAEENVSSFNVTFTNSANVTALDRSTVAEPSLTPNRTFVSFHNESRLMDTSRMDTSRIDFRMDTSRIDSRMDTSKIDSKMDTSRVDTSRMDFTRMDISRIDNLRIPNENITSQPSTSMQDSLPSTSTAFLDDSRNFTLDRHEMSRNIRQSVHSTPYSPTRTISKVFDDDNTPVKIERVSTRRSRKNPSVVLQRLDLENPKIQNQRRSNSPIKKTRRSLECVIKLTNIEDRLAGSTNTQNTSDTDENTENKQRMASPKVIKTRRKRPAVAISRVESRPRRAARPTSMAEPSLNKKMRRA